MTHSCPPAKEHPDARRRALRAIAVFEALKGLAALAAGIGLLGLLGLLHYADLLSDINLRTLAPVAMAYIAGALARSLGLVERKSLGGMAGGPVGRSLHPAGRGAPGAPARLFINAGILAANMTVVAFMAFQLWKRRSPHDGAAAPAGRRSRTRSPGWNDKAWPP